MVLICWGASRPLVAIRRPRSTPTTPGFAHRFLRSRHAWARHGVRASWKGFWQYEGWQAGGMGRAVGAAAIVAARSPLHVQENASGNGSDVLECLRNVRTKRTYKGAHPNAPCDFCLWYMCTVCCTSSLPRANAPPSKQRHRGVSFDDA
jgi:hypothetical protein